MQTKWKNTVQASSLKWQNLKLIFPGHVKCNQKEVSHLMGASGWEWFVKAEGRLRLLFLQQPLKSIHCVVIAKSLQMSPWQPLIWKIILAWTILHQLTWHFPLQWSFPLFVQMSEDGPMWILSYFLLSWKDNACSVYPDIKKPSSRIWNGVASPFFPFLSEDVLGDAPCWCHPCWFRVRMGSLSAWLVGRFCPTQFHQWIWRRYIAYKYVHIFITYPLFSLIVLP